MRKLKLAELRVESFATISRLPVATEALNSLDYATQCDCSAGPRCTLPCVEYSQATDIQICCG